jgi:hypothetical protein
MLKLQPSFKDNEIKIYLGPPKYEGELSLNNNHHMVFITAKTEFLMAVAMKNAVIWDVMA